jgi:phosphatidylserine decarboxylase
MPDTPLPERLAVALQHLLPKRALTELMGRLASAEAGGLTQAAVRAFVRRYGVNMEEALEPDLSRYRSFNEFFTRPLRPGARPLAQAELICPVDGAISQFGPSTEGRLLQAKGHDYSVAALLGGAAAEAAPYEGGLFATLYLSPRDYHRVHMPCAGRLLGMRHVPGTLYSVNPTTARGVPGLFARNERVVCFFEQDGERPLPFVVVLVGATIVGSMATVWHGTVNPPRSGEVRDWRYDQGKPIALQQGDEMGRFLLGSTAVLLFPPGFGGGSLQFNPAWQPAGAIRMGEVMATRGPDA